MIRNFQRENAKIQYSICKICKVKFARKSNILKPYCDSHDCMTAYGLILLEKQKAKQGRDKAKAIDEKVKAMKPDANSTKNKKALQNEINKLARSIDASLGFDTCIDCGSPFDNHQIDACHLISRGSNSSLKYNLHNLHSGHNHCNVYNPKHETNYRNGLIWRYGMDYLHMIELLPLKYPEIHLNNQEIVEKLALVRKINRTFNTYSFIDGNSARETLNKIINIYK